MGWIWLAFAIALLTCGIGLSAWALFWDRARGRRRCPRCWYDMAGAEGLRCPECGHVVKRERGLFKTRRRWGFAVLGVLVVLAGYGVSVTPRVRAHGWARGVPSAAIVLFAPLPEPFRNLGPRDPGLLGRINSRLWIDLYSRDRRPRGASGRLALWQRRVVLTRRKWAAEDAGPIVQSRRVWPRGADVYVEIAHPE